jgi:hypothetical protein
MAKPSKCDATNCEKEHAAHLTFRWQGDPADVVVVRGGPQAYVNVEWRGQLVSLDGKVLLRRLADAIVEALER